MRKFESSMWRLIDSIIRMKPLQDLENIVKIRETPGTRRLLIFCSRNYNLLIKYWKGALPFIVFIKKKIIIKSYNWFIVSFNPKKNKSNSIDILSANHDLRCQNQDFHSKQTPQILKSQPSLWYLLNSILSILELL